MIKDKDKTIFKNIVKKNKSFVVVSHLAPDADALGSTLAVGLFLKSIGKKVTMINQHKVPLRLDFMPSSKQVKSVKNVSRTIKADVMIAVDCGDDRRIGDVKDVVEVDHVLNIDHHVTNTKFGDSNIVDSKASSTAEVLFELLTAAKCKFTPAIAKSLYLGIMTDTGSFKYESTAASTHEVTAKLMTICKIPVQDYYRKMYEEVPAECMMRLLKLLNRVEYISKKQIAVVTITKRTRKTFSKEFDLKDKMFSFLRSMVGVEVVVVFQEIESTLTRVNFRSQASVDVAAIAAHFNGGGHVRASGCQVDMNIAAAKKKVLPQVRKQL